MAQPGSYAFCRVLRALCFRVHVDCFDPYVTPPQSATKSVAELTNEKVLQVGRS